MITPKHLRKLFQYNKRTGVLIWSCGPRAGRPAGCNNGRGYITVRISEKNYSASRIAWAIVNGRWPRVYIDHKKAVTGQHYDNRYSNLREATQKQNLANACGHRDRYSKLKGAYRSGRRWRSCIMVNGEQHHLGSFTTAVEAHKAYKRAARKTHGSFANTETRTCLQ